MTRSSRKQKNRKVSLIIPAYKQAKTIRNELIHIREVMEKLRYDYEIIVVVDGKIDKTFENANKVKSSKIIVTGYEHNHGKGHAIRFGIARATGDIIAFIDAGMDLNPNGLSLLLEHFEWYNADIIVGSKLHPVSKVTYPFIRKVFSFGYRTIVRLMFGLTIKDTQVGMKFYRREVLEDVLPRLLVKTYAFDVEILAVAYHLGYKRIFEAPVEIYLNVTTSIISKGIWKIIFHMLLDTSAVFYRLKILRYYDNGNKRKWKFDPELNFKINLP